MAYSETKEKVKASLWGEAFNLTKVLGCYLFDDLKAFNELGKHHFRK